MLTQMGEWRKRYTIPLNTAANAMTVDDNGAITATEV
jgi:hypothetical protein